MAQKCTSYLVKIPIQLKGKQQDEASAHHWVKKFHNDPQIIRFILLQGQSGVLLFIAGASQPSPCSPVANKILSTWPFRRARCYEVYKSRLVSLSFWGIYFDLEVLGYCKADLIILNCFSFNSFLQPGWFYGYIMRYSNPLRNYYSQGMAHLGNKGCFWGLNMPSKCVCSHDAALQSLRKNWATHTKA